MITNHFFDILLDVSLRMALKSQRAGLADMNAPGQTL